jgi:hypothetical protein
MITGLKGKGVDNLQDEIIHFVFTALLYSAVWALIEYVA